ncbi:MAG: 50S ribosomal protein L24 [Rickettsiales bacterium]|nr:50S ribosomal protein L24 [Rickettsiales bacterium]
MANKLKKGDSVIVIAGKDKGKTGEILKVISDDSRVVVSGVNMATIHKKPTAQTPGQRVKEEKSIHVSNVAYAEDGKPVKVGFKVEDGKKVRISKKSKNKIG